MPLRWKLFLFLLAFSLIPMVVVSAVHRQETRQLGTTIGEGINVGISGLVARELTQTAKDSAVVMARSKTALDFAVEVVARETEKALATGGADPVGKALAAASDFGRPGMGPTDLAPRPGYGLPATDGHAPLAISRTMASWTAPGGTPEAALRQGQAVLGGVAPGLREIFEQLPDVISFVGVVLETGPCAVYPGHGRFPADFDPRTSAWYREAREVSAAGSLRSVWKGPAPDPVTGRMVFTVARPIIGPDGVFAGAAFLDVFLPQALHEGEMSDQWSAALRSYLVSRVPDPGTGKDALRIWAGPENDAHLSLAIAMSGDRITSGPWLLSEDGPRYEAFMERMAAQPAGSTVMTFQGQECFWAYASPLPGMQFVLVLPSAVVAPYADEALQEVGAASSMALATAGAASVAVLLAAALGAFVGSKSVTNPLAEVMRAWKRVAAGDFSIRLDFKTRDERAAMAQAFNETMPKLADHLRLRESLQLAKEVQGNLLPKAPPCLPGLDVAGVNLSCDETGGDYFDYFPVQRRGMTELAVVIGDVTGHGVPSALLMATGRALLLAAGQELAGADETPPPWRRLTVANRLLAEDVGDSGRFMTLFWAEIHPETGRVCWVRAGHDPAYLLEPGDRPPVELHGAGLPLGIVPDFVYQEQEVVLAPGQILLMGTDGIWEARDASDAMYGKDRFLEVARRHAAEPAAAIRDAVLADLAAFKGGLPLEDDVTLVVVSRPRPA
ncbi:SpoIIE family protein phosphatase [Desulfovibrio sulfodismutans]|uniref:SpoIIE family protein phosphatase n=1 Tax=Desulfolutivibrio sulfodismutans TaxID=63561 RepID=A0A7K3NKM7_9BACT|nr:SpoIIE family protein phosphatase [Desulfolutivibrio sulfodismutans]NDY56756.1 SpoIIE family protein phosphatase [Desulfolutivibrio sulfodismutans]QLA13300.1 SpoIIE family protein phosphatase [Desulfolutivibrio sulfodismutans DSM 3696]